MLCERVGVTGLDVDVPKDADVWGWTSAHTSMCSLICSMSHSTINHKSLQTSDDLCDVGSSSKTWKLLHYVLCIKSHS